MSSNSFRKCQVSRTYLLNSIQSHTNFNKIFLIVKLTLAVVMTLKPFLTNQTLMEEEERAAPEFEYTRHVPISCITHMSTKDQNIKSLIIINTHSIGHEYFIDKFPLGILRILRMKYLLLYTFDDAYMCGSITCHPSFHIVQEKCILKVGCKK